MIVFKKTAGALCLLSCALLYGCAGSASEDLSASDKVRERAVYANALSFMPDSISENYVYETPYSVNIPLNLMVPLYTSDAQDRWKNRDKPAAKTASEPSVEKRGPIKVIKRGDGRYSALDGHSTLLILDRLGARTVPVELTYPQSVDISGYEQFKSITRQGRLDFVSRVSGIAGRFGGRSEIITRSLTEKSIKKQALDDYGGNFGGITDVLVGRIFFDRKDRLKKALDYIRIRDDIIAIEDNFSKSPDSKKESTALLRTGSGAIGTIYLTLAR